MLKKHGLQKQVHRENYCPCISITTHWAGDDDEDEDDDDDDDDDDDSARSPAGTARTEPPPSHSCGCFPPGSSCLDHTCSEAR